MDLNTELNDFDETEFRAWFDATAREGINYDETLYEALDILEQDQRRGTTPSYELGGAYTKSGNPEIYYL